MLAEYLLDHVEFVYAAMALAAVGLIAFAVWIATLD